LVGAGADGGAAGGACGAASSGNPASGSRARELREQLRGDPPQQVMRPAGIGDQERQVELGLARRAQLADRLEVRLGDARERVRVDHLHAGLALEVAGERDGQPRDRLGGRLERQVQRPRVPDRQVRRRARREDAAELVDELRTRRGALLRERVEPVARRRRPRDRLRVARDGQRGAAVAALDDRRQLVRRVERATARDAHQRRDLDHPVSVSPVECRPGARRGRGDARLLRPRGDLRVRVGALGERALGAAARVGVARVVGILGAVADAELDLGFGRGVGGDPGAPAIVEPERPGRRPGLRANSARPRSQSATSSEASRSAGEGRARCRCATPSASWPRSSSCNATSWSVCRSRIVGAG
jgi:hypothetical protein